MSPDEAAEANQERTPERTARKGDGSGWRWKGERDHCRFLVDKQCFSTRAEACQAAGCSENGCQEDEALPANVSCGAE
ncbi:hypothetical protein [Haliangium sp.]|uniref:hypothetical protein n=1 Tax=Haliangium sp. TaxID=2663208 RepID=UPI003D13D9CE